MSGSLSDSDEDGGLIDSDSDDEMMPDEEEAPFYLNGPGGSPPDAEPFEDGGHWEDGPGGSPLREEEDFRLVLWQTEVNADHEEIALPEPSSTSSESACIPSSCKKRRISGKAPVDGFGNKVAVAASASMHASMPEQVSQILHARSQVQDSIVQIDDSLIQIDDTLADDLDHDTLRLPSAPDL